MATQTSERRVHFLDTAVVGDCLLLFGRVYVIEALGHVVNVPLPVYFRLRLLGTDYWYLHSFDYLLTHDAQATLPPRGPEPEQKPHAGARPRKPGVPVHWTPGNDGNG